mmetsp:Transcript_47988/g.111996  ORF Transcript_47988/g.111996 Transcript_47988/m.111996 type:complete len:317 (-) Transcript_47988:665-1615(-)
MDPARSTESFFSIRKRASLCFCALSSADSSMAVSLSLTRFSSSVWVFRSAFASCNSRTSLSKMKASALLLFRISCKLASPSLNSVMLNTPSPSMSKTLHNSKSLFKPRSDFEGSPKRRFRCSRTSPSERQVSEAFSCVSRIPAHRCSGHITLLKCMANLCGSRSTKDIRGEVASSEPCEHRLTSLGLSPELRFSYKTSNSAHLRPHSSSASALQCSRSLADAVIAVSTSTAVMRFKSTMGTIKVKAMRNSTIMGCAITSGNPLLATFSMAKNSTIDSIARGKLPNRSPTDFPVASNSSSFSSVLSATYSTATIPKQ